MGPYAGCLADEADLTRRAAILAPTAGGKQFISDFTTVILKGPQSETPHKHTVRVSLLSCLEGVTHSKPHTRSMVSWLSQVTLGLLRGILTKALLRLYRGRIEAKLTLSCNGRC